MTMMKYGHQREGTGRYGLSQEGTGRYRISREGKGRYRISRDGNGRYRNSFTEKQKGLYFQIRNSFGKLRHQVVVELYKWLGPLRKMLLHAQIACYALENLFEIHSTTAKIGTLGLHKAFQKQPVLILGASTIQITKAQKMDTNQTWLKNLPRYAFISLCI